MKISNTPKIIRTHQEFKKWYKPYIRILDESLNDAYSGNSSIKKARSKNRTREASHRNKFEAQLFDEKTSSNINGVKLLFEQIDEKLLSMKRYLYLKAIEGPLKDTLKRNSSGALDILNKDGTSINIFSKPKENIFRLLVKNNENKVSRGYLIEDGNKLIANFSLKRPNFIPSSMIYASREQLDNAASTLNEDLSFARRVLEQAKQITDNLKISSKQ